MQLYVLKQRKTNNFLLIGKKAKISASVEAKNAKIAGIVSNMEKK